MATYTPDGGSALTFALLIDPPTRQTSQQVSERLVPGSDDAVIDVIGKSVTKIRGIGKFDSFAALKTFEGAVGTDGVLIYSEESSPGIAVLLVSLERTRVTPGGVQLASVEFWIIA